MAFRKKRIGQIELRMVVRKKRMPSIEPFMPFRKKRIRQIELLMVVRKK